MIIGKKQIEKLRIPRYVAQTLQEGGILANSVIRESNILTNGIQKGVSQSTDYADIVENRSASSEATRIEQVADDTPLTIAIDGPAGTGKSTIAKALAEHYGCLYFSAGMLYRSLAYACWQKNIDINNETAVCASVQELTLEYRVQDSDNEKSLAVYLDNREITPLLHSEIISLITPTVAKYPLVREHFRQIQRSIASTTDIVMEGRDICTVVLPNAKHKFYLTASAEVRAERRLAQITCTDGADYVRILEEIKARDKEDGERAISPLKCADDAVLIDNSDMDIGESVQAFCDVIDSRENYTSLVR